MNFLGMLVNSLLENPIALIMISLFVWFIIYFVIMFLISRFLSTNQLDKTTQLHIVESGVAIIQGIICGTIGLIAIYRCKHDVMGAELEIVYHYCFIGSGYFIYDLFAMYYSHLLTFRRDKTVSIMESIPLYLTSNTLYIAHHVILICLLFPLLVTYSSMGHFFVGCFFSMELSSPFVNGRIILSQLKMKNTNYYFVNGITMMVVFALCRVIVFPYMYVTYMVQEVLFSEISYMDAFLKIPLVCHICCLLVLAPQLYWLSLMIKGVIAAVAKKVKSSKKAN